MILMRKRTDSIEIFVSLFQKPFREALNSRIRSRRGRLSLNKKRARLCSVQNKLNKRSSERALPADVRKGFAFPSIAFRGFEALPPHQTGGKASEIGKTLSERQSLSAHLAAKPRLLNLF